MPNKFPEGWDEQRVRRVLTDYEDQTEDEAGYEARRESLVEVPIELIPIVRELIARHRR